jgi:phosphosulfolactate phosphohydrolase-like enzyme
VTANDAISQGQYQVRFDWGIAGLRAIAPDVDVVVLVDVLGASPALSRELSDHPAIVIAGGLTNAGAVARWALEQQGGKGDRFGVALIAAGEPRSDGSLRFALEDLLGCGAIIESLAEVGIDYYSPEAAAAAAAFTGLRSATRHLIAATESGRAMIVAGRASELETALELDSTTEIPILREFGFGA